MLAAHCVEQQRKILDIARHGTLHTEIAVDLGGWRMADAADARPQADDATEACGVATRNRPCRSRVRARPCLLRAPRPRRPRSRRPSIPGVAGCAEHLVEGVGAGAEFRRVGFGVDHPAAVFEMFDQKIGARRNSVLVDRRAMRGQHALDISQILNRHRKAREQAALAGGLFHQRPGARAARSKHSVGRAFTLPSTSAIRCSRASSRSRGVTSPELSLPTTAHAVALTSPRSDATDVSEPFISRSASQIRDCIPKPSR